MKKRAFTLIELLVVMTLIGLLLALLVPGLTAARRLAARTSCAGNLKIIGNGYNSYYADNSEWPVRDNVTTPFEWDVAYFDQLFERYLADPRAYYCPDSAKYERPGDDWDRSWPVAKRKISYAILDGKPGPSSNWAGGAGWAGAQGSKRSKTGGDYQIDNYNYLTLTEAQPFMMGTAFQKANAPIMGDLNYENDAGGHVANHLTGRDANPVGMNILFFDGSVSWVVEEDESTVVQEQPFQRRWRRLWKDPAGTASYLWFLWGPREIELEYVQQ